MSKPEIARKLTERTYWDRVHESEGRDLNRPRQPSLWRRSKEAVKRAAGRGLRDRLGNYDDYILWETVLPQVLGGRAGQRAVEIGSAPGEYLVRLRERFGLDVYGIEYSPVGAELNRTVFEAAGVGAENVIEGDFFAVARQAPYRGSFDIVISRGFIEHFDDPTDAIDRHLDLLRDGGLLIVSIPNLSGLNLLCMRLLDRKIVAMHNLAIMAQESFEVLFAKRPVTREICRYYGTFNLCLFNTSADSRLRPFLRASQRCQPALNLAFRSLFGRKSPEHRWTSPNLIFVGAKTPAAAQPS